MSTQQIEITQIEDAIDRALEEAIVDLVIEDTSTAASIKKSIFEKLRAAIEEATEDDEVPVGEDITETETDEKPPKQKKQYIIVVSDPDKQITQELTGWVIQIPEEESILSVRDNIHKSLYDFNASRRGRKLPVETIGEGFESVQAKTFKNCGIYVKTKTPVFVVTTDNILPKAVNT